MNSLELFRIIKQNNFCKKSFLGVFPSDKYPKEITSFPSSFILNADKSGEDGSHWMVIYIPNAKTFEFFDFFGRPPFLFLKPLMENFTHKQWNKVKMQNDQDISCGPFVIFFLISRCRGFTFDAIINILRHKTWWKDSFVKLYTANLA